MQSFLQGSSNIKLLLLPTLVRPTVGCCMLLLLADWLLS
jgi:hypothetical protein